MNHLISEMQSTQIQKMTKTKYVDTMINIHRNIQSMFTANNITCHCIRSLTSKTLEETSTKGRAAAMIDLLTSLCTSTTVDNLDTEQWRDLILATFNYVCLLNNNKNEYGCFTAACEHNNATRKQLDNSTETLISETTWFQCTQVLLESTKAEITQAEIQKDVNKALQMRPTIRAMLLALTHDDFTDAINTLLQPAKSTQRLHTETVSMLSHKAIEILKNGNTAEQNCPVQNQLCRYLHDGIINTLRCNVLDEPWTEEDKEVPDDTASETIEEPRDWEAAMGDGGWDSDGDWVPDT